MNRSIKSYLLINLLISLTFIVSVIILLNAYISHKNFQKHLDSQLALTAYTILSFIKPFDNSESLSSIQSMINTLPMHFRDKNKTFVQNQKIYQELFTSIQYVVFNQKNQSILNSYAAPSISYKKKDGFFNWDHLNKYWRVYSIDSLNKRFHVMVMQQYDVRLSIEKTMIKDSLFILLAAYPILAFIIWLIVGKGLHVIQNTCLALRERNSKKLSPINNESSPKEILPLVNEINGLFERLNQSFNREKRFAADAAHELKTPIAALATQAQLAIKSKDKAEVHASLKNVLKGVKRSSHAIDQLLILSRMIPHSQINEPKKINLNKLVTDMIIELFHKADEKKIELELKSIAKSNIIQANEASILILLRNLMDNAIRYSQENTTVVVQVTQLFQEVKLSIIDQGPGIPEQLRKRVFDRFYRVLGSKETGTGLGLSIVSQIVDLHYGRIKLGKPKDHQGLQVDIYFPILK
ncbi:ATP-binding protein [Gammaproteobacteria bacterium]|nr:ATP-binding protein [Gammaproteobacteria bacterium]